MLRRSIKFRNAKDSFAAVLPLPGSKNDGGILGRQLGRPALAATPSIAIP
jgi:hypothetical protein